MQCYCTDIALVERCGHLAGTFLTSADQKKTRLNAIKQDKASQVAQELNFRIKALVERAA